MVLERAVTTDTIFIQSCIAKPFPARSLAQILQEQSEEFKTEVRLYYAGLQSGPLLLARSSSITTPWKEPSISEPYTQHELRPVGDHALSNGVWEKKYAPHVLRLLESQGVMYTSVDVVRIAKVGEPSAPVILWIGVIPQTLAPSEGLPVALMCKEYLEQNNITDVDVELRESVVVRLAGPKFLNPPFTVDPLDSIIEVGRPLTSTLGLSICAENTSWLEGTGGFFIAQGGDNNRIFLVTARHVVLPPGIVSNNMFEHTDPNQPRRNVLLLGSRAFNALLKSTELAVGRASFRIDHAKAVEGEEDNAAERERELVRARGALEELTTFHQNVFTHWSTSENRVVGHVVFSPPLGVDVGDQSYARDFAIIEMDASKLNASNFKGNVIDLGTQIHLEDFGRMVFPHPTNRKDFIYPPDRRLHLKGTISQEEIHHPTTLDENGDPCLMVLKRGTATGLTIGRSNNIPSFVRHYFDDREPQTSMQWAILSRNSKSGPFSKAGDSGAIIVDGLGRMCGLLTGGAGAADSSDITYATPIQFLLRCITEKFPDAHLYPVLT